MIPRALNPILASSLTMLVGIYPYLQRRNRLTGLFALANLFLALYTAADIRILALFPFARETLLFLDRITLIFGILMIVTFIRFSMEFTGIPFKHYERWWWAQCGVAVVLAVLSPTSAFIAEIRGSGQLANDVPGLGIPIYILFTFSTSGFAVYQLARRYPQSVGHQRNQILYLVVAFAVLLLEAIIYFIALYFPAIPFEYYYLQVAYVVILAYAILSHNLLDIRVVVRRTLIYSLTSAALTALSLFIMVFMMRFTMTGFSHQIVISTALSAVVITLLFHPLVRKAQRIIDRLFFRRRLDSEARLLAFSETLTGHQSVDETINTLCRVIAEDFHPRSWALYLRPIGKTIYTAERQSGDFPPIVSLPNEWTERFGLAPTPVILEPDRLDPLARPPVAAAIPLTTHDELLGYLLLGEKGSGEPYLGEDLALMRILVNQLAVVYERPKLLREVTGGFVHEIKIPLSNIVLPAELSLLDLQDAENGSQAWTELSGKLKTRLAFIVSQAMLAARRIEAIQQLSEMDLPQNVAIQPDALIAGSLTGLERPIEASGAKIAVDVSPSLPTIEGDARQLEIVFVNLIKNGLEAMALNGERERRLTISARVDEKKMCLRIADTGPGIKEVDPDNLFKPHITTKGELHRGLGLFLANRIVQAHRGSLRLESTSSMGTVFTVTLPLSQKKGGS